MRPVVGDGLRHAAVVVDDAGGVHLPGVGQAGNVGAAVVFTS